MVSESMIAGPEEKRNGDRSAGALTIHRDVPYLPQLDADEALA